MTHAKGGPLTPITPATVLDLSAWKLTLPTGSQGSPTEIRQPALATFADPLWFRVVDGAVVFRAAVNGVTTSGSANPRSELREMTSGGGNASWSAGDGHTHTLVVDEAFTHLPNPRTDGGTAGVVGAQIHDSANDISVFRCEPGKIWVTRGNDNHFAIADSNYVLGTRFRAKFEVAGGELRAFYNGRLVTTIAAAGSGWYFKAGCYTQAHSGNSSPDDTTNYGEVTVYSVTVAHGTPLPDPPPPPAAGKPVVMLIRHAEKPADPNSHVLSPAGTKRAFAIADLFTAAPIRAGLARPDRLIVSEGNTSSLRPWQTLAPLAAALHEPEINTYAASDWKKLAKALPGFGGVTLVCWSHSELPKIVKALKNVIPKPPKAWPGDRYDIIWILTGDGFGGWMFRQQAEQLMPGDNPGVI